MGFSYHEVKKGVFVDGHERKDVIKYRNDVFLKAWKEASRRFVDFQDGSWEMPRNLQPEEKPLILVTHDESTFNANDGKRRLWTQGGEQPLRPKGKGKGIMVSGFLTPGGILEVPSHVSNAQLLEDPTWLRNDEGVPIRQALQYLEYGRDNYWTGEKMVEHTKFAIKILECAFPGCEGFFAFDNASNHCAYAPDALLATKMNLGPGGKQPLLRDGWDHSQNLPQPMVFGQDYPVLALRGKPKGIRQVLLERGLWQHQRKDGAKCLLICHKKKIAWENLSRGVILCLRENVVQQLSFSLRKTSRLKKGRYKNLSKLLATASSSTLSSTVNLTLSNGFGVLPSTTHAKTVDTLWMSFEKLFLLHFSQYL